MRRKRQTRKRVALVLGMLVLCVLAAAYILKLAGDMKEQREIAQAEEAARAEAEAAAAEEAAAEEEKAKKSENVYAYSGSTEDSLYTLAAYDSAVEAGAGSLVLPFVVSQDGTVYVADDDYAQSLTGYGGYFSGMTDGQIDNLETKAGTKVLKLNDVFEKYGRDVHYIIELKYTSERNLMAFKDLIEKSDYADVVSVASEYFSGLRSIENEFANMPKIFLCSGEDEWGEALNLEYLDGISVSKEMMSEERCKAAHEKNKKFGAHILSSKDEMSSASGFGADFFFTDAASAAAESE